LLHFQDVELNSFRDIARDREIRENFGRIIHNLKKIFKTEEDTSMYYICSAYNYIVRWNKAEMKEEKARVVIRKEHEFDLSKICN
jgi:hypothetical protein